MLLMKLGTLFTLTAISTCLLAQDELLLTGRALQVNGEPVHGLMIVNKRTYLGKFGKNDGTFSLKVQKTDTINFGAFGFSSMQVCLADSVLKESYELTLVLKPLRVEVAEVEIIAPRELERIYQDIENLGFKDSDYRVSGVDALSSPITFLYEQFSRRERSKRLVAEMENDDRRRELLKDLFRLYVDYEIIDLSDDQFDRFIDFLNVDDQFLQSLSQHEFLLFVKDRFEVYRKEVRRLQDTDFDYHLDQE